MLEIFFVMGFFIMLVITGVSLLGVMVALIAAAIVMLIAGLFTMAIKVLPWLLLAIVVVWLWRRYQGSDTASTPYDRYRKKYDSRYRRGGGDW
ncbi:MULTISPECIES: envelope stress response protein PspG [Dickeya]|uniref:Envelope stress response protein PspG n=1 Tax=Dickeya oryzae TaxID=1240404 RepID=A0AB39IP63_9GAMM|nr:MULTISPECIES: envelope stress response protein PspG [Dickeya]MBP2845880.1 envelope stress response protein PspG [Dickeya oryzae]MBP2848365.1 envelope stress response protein PspG [Dickeya oryzae]MBP2857225.1 envelope stress response protein PspG [Dickeya oryzae]MCA6989261.1 envelope stress response protein PspG [Dickeya oryzae]MCA6996175.1 envelope stress response protein PspG [Dickeya oryzae]